MSDAHVIRDPMDPARSEALSAALDLGLVGPALPPFYHQVYFWEARPPGDLGRDGHPKVGGLIPDTGLPRRMWAGGWLDFHAPLCTGEPAEKHSTVESAARKSGRTGDLAFVTLRHDIFQGGQNRVTEWQALPIPTPPRRNRRPRKCPPAKTPPGPPVSTRPCCSAIRRSPSTGTGPTKTSVMTAMSKITAALSSMVRCSRSS